KRVARHHGIQAIDRPEALSGDAVPLEQVVRHGYDEIRATLGAELEALVVLLANAPTVTSEQIDQGVRMLRADATLNAVISASAHDEFHPSYALCIGSDGRLRRHAAATSADRAEPIYFPDALLWVIRPSALEAGGSGSGWLVDVEAGGVAPLVHEGYGDVDYTWQIPLVEEWLRRRGFDDDRTPYDASPARGAAVAVPSSPPALRSPASRRVLITTVPFGVLSAGTEPITARVMDAAPNLKLISRVGVGLDNVDLAAARARGITVSYTPEAPSPAVAELAVGLMLALLRDIPGADRVMRDGVWRRTMGRRLSNMTVGVIGVGRIGKRVVRHLCGGFPGVRILADDLAPDRGFGSRYGIEWASKQEIYAAADVITLHLPLTPQTRALIGARELALMKPTTVVVNTSRGNMIHEQELALALREGRIAGAAIDVFEREPYSG